LWSGAELEGDRRSHPNISCVLVRLLTNTAAGLTDTRWYQCEQCVLEGMESVAMDLKRLVIPHRRFRRVNSDQREKLLVR
jgi:hypothetical protein